MDKTKKYLIFLITYSLIITGIYVFRIGGKHFIALTTIINYVTLMVPLLFGYLTIKSLGLKNQIGKSALFLSLSIISLLLGDFLWDLSGRAVLSIADVFYFSYYPLLIIGIVIIIKSFSPTFFKKRKKLYFFGLISLAALLIYVKFFPVSWNYEASVIENIVTYGYTIADFSLIFLIFLIVPLIFSEVYRQTWICVGLSLITYWSGNIIYSIMYDTYKQGDLVDLIWLFSYLVFAWALILLRYNAEKVLGKIESKLEKGKSPPKRVITNKP
ncbi:MAG: hypothetical protein QW404_00765 [Candidatus Nanoarchaeia archaeon]